MSFELEALPFDKKSLAPFISEETLDFHYGKHHKTYVDNLNRLVVGTEFADKPLVEIIKKSSGAIFNNAAQIWNHDFYWQCLSGDKSKQQVSQELLAELDNNFGGLDKFKEEFTKAALGLFGSGWVWLVKENNKLTIVTTGNAGTPITTEQKPLLVCDVWEHAYYIDYRNARAKYLEAFWQVINWGFVRI